MQYQYRDPDSQITVKVIEGEDGQVDCGDTALEPEVVMSMRPTRHTASGSAR